MTPTELASFSNGAIYASMLVLTFAMIAFAVSFAAGRRRAAQPVSTTVAVGSGSTAVLERERQQDELQPGRRSANIGMALTWLGFFLLLVGVVARAVWAGRVPWGNMYEFSISSALGILAVFLLVSIKKDVRWLGLFVVIPVLLTLGLAVTVLYTEAAQLVPALKSYWLVIHVSAAVICAGAFTVATAAIVLSLIARAMEKRGKQMHRIPSSAALDSFGHRIIMFAFPLWTFAVVAGAIWAENAWGRYWGWDPKETWAFITWVLYAGYLHARATAGWRSKAPYIAILGFVAFLINYFGINLFVNSLHSYSGM